MSSDFEMKNEFLTWIASPSGVASIGISTGYLLNNTWHRGIVRLKPPGGRTMQVAGFQRPSQAVISDAGFAAVADWLSVDKADGKLVFIRPTGSVFKQHRLDFNLGELAMDPSGSLVFLSTAASLLESAKLLCYGLETGELHWVTKAPKPGAEIVVESRERCLLVGRPYRSCGSDHLLKISFDGRELERWPDSPYQAIDFGNAEREGGRPAEAERWFLIAAESDISPRWRAVAYRGLGDLAENAGQVATAIAYYEKALEHDSGVGVKRKLELLRKQGKGQ